MPFSFSCKKGFSLIELAIILVVIGVFSTAGISLVKSVKNYSSVRDTEKELENILLKTIIDVRTNNSIPSAEIFSESKDGFGRATSVITSENSDICGLKSPTTLKICKNTECTSMDVINNIAVFAFSSGSAPGLAYEVQHEPNLVTNIIVPFTPERIFKWLTMADVAGEVDCTGIKIVTGTLPPVYSETFYEAAVYSVPPAEKWCLEADPKTAALLKINEKCSDDNFIDASFLSLKLSLDEFYETSVREVTVFAESKGVKTSKKFAVSFYSFSSEPEAEDDIFAIADNLIETTQFGKDTQNINYEVDIKSKENGALDGFSIKGNSSGSICFWLDQAFEISETFRIYYEAKTSYKDNDAFSMGSAFGGYGFVFFPATYDIKNLTCGLPGSLGLGYGNLNFGGKGFVIETDLYPNRAFDFLVQYPKNHLAIMPCNFTSGTSKVCSTNHSPSLTPLCSDDKSCVEPATNAQNWLEDTENHPMRLEIHLGFADSACTTAAPDGNFLLVKKWADCKDCNDISVNYTAEPLITQCFNAEDMKKIRFGFTFGGETGTDIEFSNLNLSVK